jgi:transcriptional regulator with XRE-family HTH domain
MSPMDKAYTISRMIEAGYSQKDIAVRLGYSKALVSQVKNFVDFPLSVQKALDIGKMTQAAAFELIPLLERPEELAEKAKELIASNGKVTTQAVRASNRKSALETDDAGAAGEGGEAAEAEKATETPIKAAKTARSMKELMAFLRDFSEAEKGADLSPAQIALGVVLKFAEGKIKEKAAQKQLDTKLAVAVA